MTREEAIRAYTDQFGGFPFMSTRGLPDKVVVELVQKALEENREMSFDFDDDSDF